MLVAVVLLHLNSYTSVTRGWRCSRVFYILVHISWIVSHFLSFLFFRLLSFWANLHTTWNLLALGSLAFLYKLTVKIISRVWSWIFITNMLRSVNNMAATCHISCNKADPNLFKRQGFVTGCVKWRVVSDNCGLGPICTVELKTSKNVAFISHFPAFTTRYCPLCCP